MTNTPSRFRVGSETYLCLPPKIKLMSETIIERFGNVPLPPYIERRAEVEDVSRYQTVYARSDGSVAAPTAGLHFDESLIERLLGAGIRMTFVTLHVGAGTFAPVRETNPQQPYASQRTL